MLSLIPVKRTFAIHPCSSADRFSLHYLLMNAIASRPVSGSFQLPLTETSPTRRLVLRALEAGECLSAFKNAVSVTNMLLEQKKIRPRQKDVDESQTKSLIPYLYKY